MTRLAVLVSVTFGLGGCLGIEGTDVSTGAAGSTGSGVDDSTFSDTIGDPTSASTSMTGTTDPTDSDSDSVTSPSTGLEESTDAGEGPDTDSDPSGTSGSGSGGQTDDTTGDSGTGSSTDTGTDTTGTDSGSESSTDTGATCGDGAIDGDEECDGKDLGGQSCEGLGYDGGELACADSCMFDTSACFE